MQILLQEGQLEPEFPNLKFIYIYIYEKKQSIQKIEIWKISRISSAVFRVVAVLSFLGHSLFLSLSVSLSLSLSLSLSPLSI